MQRCRCCGHERIHHRIGGADGHCAIRIGYGWDEKKAAFTKTAPCRCPCYLPPKVMPNQCAHEYLETDDHCVHCHQVRVAG